MICFWQCFVLSLADTRPARPCDVFRNTPWWPPPPLLKSGQPLSEFQGQSLSRQCRYTRADLKCVGYNLEAEQGKSNPLKGNYHSLRNFVEWLLKIHAPAGGPGSDNFDSESNAESPMWLWHLVKKIFEDHIIMPPGSYNLYICLLIFLLTRKAPRSVV